MRVSLSPIVRIFRDAEWLTASRATLVCRLFIALALAIAVVWIALSHDAIDVNGKPIGADFVSFWTASKLALSGRPTAVYDLAAHRAQQLALFQHDIGYAAFFYPPTFLLVCLPLAALPYLSSLALWLGVTGLAYWRVLRAWLGDEFSALSIFAFPAVFVNVAHGQNGFLSAAVFGGGVLMLESRPILAGACLGALVYKPHLAIVVPFALIAARRWRSLMAFGGVALCFCLLSLFFFGEPTWRAFLDATPIARKALEQNWIGNDKMQSVFAAVRLWQGGLIAAYGLQILTALSAFCALFLLHRRSFRSAAEGPAMVLAALLTSPFLLEYDFVLLAVPLAWILREARRTGFLPWEKTVCAVAFFAPAISLPLARLALIPLGPIACVATFVFVLRRGFAAKPSMIASDAKQSMPKAAAYEWIASSP